MPNATRYQGDLLLALKNSALLPVVFVKKEIAIRTTKYAAIRSKISVGPNKIKFGQI